MANLQIFLTPDEGAWGMRIKHNNKVTKWEDLGQYEKNKIINSITYWATILKKEKK